MTELKRTVDRYNNSLKPAGSCNPNTKSVSKRGKVYVRRYVCTVHYVCMDVYMYGFVRYECLHACGHVCRFVVKVSTIRRSASSEIQFKFKFVNLILLFYLLKQPILQCNCFPSLVLNLNEALPRFYGID